MNTLTTLALASALALLAGCGKSTDPHGDTHADKPAATAASASAPHADKDTLRLTPEEAQRAGLQLETLQAQPAQAQLVLTATIEANPDRLARVAPRSEGRVLSAAVQLGDRVRAGQLLAVLDSPAVGEASLTLAQARSAQRLALADFQRADSLNAQEIIPKREHLRAQSELERANAALAAAEDRMRLLGASAPAGNRAQASFAVTAPLSGTVVEKKATVGALAGPTEPLFVLADLSTVWVQASVAEAQLAQVRPGMPASVTVPAYPGERFTGQVAHVASLLDKDTRSLPVRVVLPNADGRLKPEMFATVTLTDTAKAGPPVLTVPDAAMVLLQGQPTVFVQQGDAYAPKPVAPGERQGNRTVITSGLKAGDVVVAAGAYALKARLLKSQIGDAH